MRKEGDSNPRYGNPYVSLANWWFQPLTHPSGTVRSELQEEVRKGAPLSIASAKVAQILDTTK